MSKRSSQSSQRGSETNTSVGVLSDSSGLYSSSVESNIPARFRNSPTVSPIISGRNDTLSMNSSSDSSGGESTQASSTEPSEVEQSESEESFGSSPPLSPYTPRNKQSSTAGKSRDYLNSIRTSLENIRTTAGILPSSPLSSQQKRAAKQPPAPPKPQQKNAGKKSFAKSIIRPTVDEDSDESDYEDSREQDVSEVSEELSEEEEEPIPIKPTPESSARAIKKSAKNVPSQIPPPTNKKLAAATKQTSPAPKKAVVKKSATPAPTPAKEAPTKTTAKTAPAKTTPIKRTNVTPKKGTTTVTVPKSPIKRRRNNVRVEIRKFRRSVEFLVPKLPFSRFVKEIVHQSNTSYRMTAEAVMALQSVSEAMISRLFEDANICAGHAKRITIGAKDVRLVRQLRVYL